MNDYFKMLENLVGKVYQKDIDISELTCLIVSKAGYYKEKYVYENGVTVRKVKFANDFDSKLSAKWILYYKKLFISRLWNHDEFSEFFTDIINNVFFAVMSSQNVLTLSSKQITSGVNKILKNEMSTIALNIGSFGRIEEYENGGKNRFRYCRVLSHQTVALPDYNIIENRRIEDVFDNNILMDIRNNLIGNPYGEKVLVAMLNSNCKFLTDAINKYIDIDKEELTFKNRKYIKEAYNIIKSTLHEYIGDANDYDWSPINSISKIRCSRGKGICV